MINTSPDLYFSADSEADGPIPGPYSMLSFALVVGGSIDGKTFTRPVDFTRSFRANLKPISDAFDAKAMEVNGLDREALKLNGDDAEDAMTRAAEWIRDQSKGATPVLVAYPLGYDWMWLYWYFMRYSKTGSPFGHSRCFDIKTAFAVKGKKRISEAVRIRLPDELRSKHPHTHDALDDAIEQAEIFANLFEWKG